MLSCAESLARSGSKTLGNQKHRSQHAWGNMLRFFEKNLKKLRDIIRHYFFNESKILRIGMFLDRQNGPRNFEFHQ